MSLPLFEEIEKLISEHGSAAILKERLELARDRFDALEAKQSALEEKIKQLEGDKSRLEMENLELKEKVQFLEDQIATSQPSRIEEIQERILIALANTPRIASEQLAKQLQIGIELANFHIKELEASKLVTGHHVLLSPTHWSLDEDGRRYLVSNGLLP